MTVGVGAPQIVDQVLASALSYPGKVALEERPGATITYDQLARDVESVSAGLSRAGLQQGEPVLFSVPPSIASITLILALMRVGATIVAADPRMGTAVFQSRVALARPTWAIAESKVFAAGATAAGRALLRWRGLQLPDLAAVTNRHVRVGRWLPGAPRNIAFEDLRREVTQFSGNPTAAPDGPALIIFTSGTTTTPRGVVHTNASLAATVKMLTIHAALDPADVVYSDQLYLNIPALMIGARSILARRPEFDGARWLADVGATGATMAFAVPSEILKVADLLGDAGGQLPSSLRRVMLGSAPAYRSFLERLRPRVGAGTEVWSVYAMSEMLPVCAIQMVEKLDTPGRGDPVGRPLPEVKICAAVDDELLVSGPNLFHGYLGAAPVREHATGDLGAIDSTGMVRLLGRKKDMMIRGHDNIYPSLVESVVESIAGVRNSCLVGFYDERIADERVFLVVESTAEPARVLADRVTRAIREGSHRIDAGAMPEEVIVMSLPVSPRSRKVDRAEVARRIRKLRASA